MGILTDAWARLRPWRQTTTVASMSEVPDVVPARRAVLVGTPGTPKWLVFDCPCRGRHRVALPLDQRARPHWTLAKASPMTLWPSVDEHRGAKRCHYVIKDGRVRWVRASGRGEGTP